MKRPKLVSAVTQQVSEQVYEHASAGRLVLTLGGDHSIAMGTISGTAKAMRERLGREIAVIWVDAHADINTPETSDSGNIHGMPVAFLTGLAKEEREDCFGWIKECHRLSVKKLVYIGLRDIDRGEKKILREQGIKAFSMHDIDRYVMLRFLHFLSFFVARVNWAGSDGLAWLGMLWFLGEKEGAARAELYLGGGTTTTDDGHGVLVTFGGGAGVEQGGMRLNMYKILTSDITATASAK